MDHSYSGIYLTLGGATAALAAQGSWAQACGVLRTPTTVSDLFAWAFAAAWCVKCGYAMYSTLRRGPVEDEQLRKQFGPVWEASSFFVGRHVFNSDADTLGLRQGNTIPHDSIYSLDHRSP